MKSLEVEDANPCMKCGSVQCSFCSKDLDKTIRMLVDMIKHNETLTWEQAEEMIGLVGKCFPTFVKI